MRRTGCGYITAQLCLLAQLDINRVQQNLATTPEDTSFRSEWVSNGQGVEQEQEKNMQDDGIGNSNLNCEWETHVEIILSFSITVVTIKIMLKGN